MERPCGTPRLGIAVSPTLRSGRAISAVTVSESSAEFPSASSE